MEHNRLGSFGDAAPGDDGDEKFVKLSPADLIPEGNVVAIADDAQSIATLEELYGLSKVGIVEAPMMSASVAGIMFASFTHNGELLVVARFVSKKQGTALIMIVRNMDPREVANIVREKVDEVLKANGIQAATHTEGVCMEAQDPMSTKEFVKEGDPMGKLFINAIAVGMGRIGIMELAGRIGVDITPSIPTEAEMGSCNADKHGIALSAYSGLDSKTGRRVVVIFILSSGGSNMWQGVMYHTWGKDEIFRQWSEFFSEKTGSPPVSSEKIPVKFLPDKSHENN